jgi:WD40 repeat protein
VWITSYGRRVVAGWLHGRVGVWDLESGAKLSHLQCRSVWTHAMAMTPDGRRLVVGSTDGALEVLDPEEMDV